MDVNILNIEKVVDREAYSRELVLGKMEEISLFASDSPLFPLGEVPISTETYSINYLGLKTAFIIQDKELNETLHNHILQYNQLLSWREGALQEMAKLRMEIELLRKGC